MQIQATPSIIDSFYIFGSVALSVERESEKLRVAGSSPAVATWFMKTETGRSGGVIFSNRQLPAITTCLFH